MRKQSLSHFRCRGPCAYVPLMINQQTGPNFASALPSSPSISFAVTFPRLSNPASTALQGLLQVFQRIHQALKLTSGVKTPFNHLKTPFKSKHLLLPSLWLSAQAQDCQHLWSASLPTIKSKSSNQALAHSRTYVVIISHFTVFYVHIVNKFIFWLFYLQ
ncbi:hypothetical protein B0H11DRAFT_703956 [Mycena galericulata]|nr:hypothetical protein B0H11DRAFT_703956 [Mycena galericulata]